MELKVKKFRLNNLPIDKFGKLYIYTVYDQKLVNFSYSIYGVDKIRSWQQKGFILPFDLFFNLRIDVLNYVPNKYKVVMPVPFSKNKFYLE